MAKPTEQSGVDASAPTGDSLTEYDMLHLPDYLRLLHAANDGEPWEEAAKVVLGLDPNKDPEQAKSTYDSHLSRARWMTEHGYRQMLRGKVP